MVYIYVREWNSFPYKTLRNMLRQTYILLKQYIPIQSFIKIYLCLIIFCLWEQFIMAEEVFTNFNLKAKIVPHENLNALNIVLQKEIISFL